MFIIEVCLSITELLLPTQMPRIIEDSLERDSLFLSAKDLPIQIMNYHGGRGQCDRLSSHMEVSLVKKSSNSTYVNINIFFEYSGLRLRNFESYIEKFLL